MTPKLQEELKYRAVLRKVMAAETDPVQAYIIAKMNGIDFDDHYDVWEPEDNK